jgi:peptide/nickel transport system ATP-binding protein
MLLASAPRVANQGRAISTDAPLNAPIADHSSSGCPFEARCPYKIGAICETTRPPLRPMSPTHRIACHLDADQMA